VQAGIQIRDLLEDLASIDLALPTMGPVAASRWPGRWRPQRTVAT
jgi:hypothetical protein